MVSIDLSTMVLHFMPLPRSGPRVQARFSCAAFCWCGSEFQVFPREPELRVAADSSAEIQYCPRCASGALLSEDFSGNIADGGIVGIYI